VRKSNKSVVSLFPAASPGSFYSFPKISLTDLKEKVFSMRPLEEEHIPANPGNSFSLSGQVVYALLVGSNPKAWCR